MKTNDKDYIEIFDELEKKAKAKNKENQEK